MKIQNIAMAGATLSLRYTRDENGVSVQVVGDAAGIFEMGDKDAEFLLSTKGWKVLAAPKPALVLEEPVAAKPAPVVEAPVAEMTTAPETEVGPDLDALDKDGLLAVAAEHGVDVKKSWSETKIREVIDAAIYGGEG